VSQNKTSATHISNLEDHVGYWLRYVSNYVSFAFQKKLEVLNVTVAEWAAMRQLYDLGTTSPSILAQAMGMSRGTVSRLLERLVSKGLVVRELDSADRRYQTINLSEKANALVPQLALIADENDKAFFSHLTDEQRCSLIELIREIAQLHGFKSIPIN
jgi:DNA-binding MarR family transcriptional regulator